MLFNIVALISAVILVCAGYALKEPWLIIFLAQVVAALAPGLDGWAEFRAWLVFSVVGAILFAVGAGVSWAVGKLAGV